MSVDASRRGSQEEKAKAEQDIEELRRVVAKEEREREKAEEEWRREQERAEADRERLCRRIEQLEVCYRICLRSCYAKPGTDMVACGVSAYGLGDARY